MNRETEAPDPPGSWVPDEDLEPVRAALEETRVLRLALEVLFSNVPGGAGGTLAEIEARVLRTEEEELRDLGTTWNYLIVRPLSPARVPPPGDLDKITAAVRTLRDFGLIINDR